VTLDDMRPIVSGLVGAAIAIWFGRAMNRRIRSRLGANRVEALLESNCVTVRIANGMFAAGVLGGLAMYRVIGFADNDWRPLALGGGFAISAPLLVMVGSAILSGKDPGESVLAYAVSQKIPAALLCAASLAGFAALLAATASLVGWP
jgi:hypothetical protein